MRVAHIALEKGNHQTLLEGLVLFRLVADNRRVYGKIDHRGGDELVQAVGDGLCIAIFIDSCGD